jgi:hypothetical protein
MISDFLGEIHLVQSVRDDFAGVPQASICTEASWAKEA